MKETETAGLANLRSREGQKHTHTNTHISCVYILVHELGYSLVHAQSPASWFRIKMVSSKIRKWCVECSHGDTYVLICVAFKILYLSLRFLCPFQYKRGEWNFVGWAVLKTLKKYIQLVPETVSLLLWIIHRRHCQQRGWIKLLLSPGVNMSLGSYLAPHPIRTSPNMFCSRSQKPTIISTLDFH